MATRTPLYYNGTQLQEMSSSMIDDLIDLAIYQYSLNPSVTLSVVGSGGNLTSVDDTRLQAGTALSDPSSFPSEAQTPEPNTVTVSYQRITKTNDTISATSDTGKTFPLYYTAGGQLQHMTVTDFRDTFIYPAIDRLILGTTTTLQGGTYFISTSTSVAGATLVSTTPIFSDTRADTTLYSAAGIPEALDQPITITNYYLHLIDGASVTLSQLPVYAEGSNNVKEYTQAEIASLLDEYIRLAAASSSSGYQLSYNIDGSGNSRGSSIVNTILTGGSGNYQTLFAGIDDYRAQEFPNGSPATANTYTFNINKV